MWLSVSFKPVWFCRCQIRLQTIIPVYNDVDNLLPTWNNYRCDLKWKMETYEMRINCDESRIFLNLIRTQICTENEKSKLTFSEAWNLIFSPFCNRDKSQIDLIFDFNYWSNLILSAFNFCLACNFRQCQLDAGFICVSSSAATLLKINRQSAVKYSVCWILHKTRIFQLELIVSFPGFETLWAVYSVTIE